MKNKTVKHEFDIHGDKHIKKQYLDFNIQFHNKMELEIRTHQIEYFRTYSLSTVPHIHKEIELVFVLNGTATVHIENSVKKISTFDMFISFPNQLHYYQDALGGDYLVILLNPDLLFNSFSDLYTVIPYSNVIRLADDESKQFISQIISLIESANSIMIIGYICLLFGKAMQNITFKERSNQNNKIIEAFFKYCNENYNQHLSLESVSKALSVSKSHLSRLIHKVLQNISFNDYINSLRINKACHLLKYTKMTITNISESIGFNSIRTFNRAFKFLNNVSPSQYREESKTNLIIDPSADTERVRRII